MQRFRQLIIVAICLVFCGCEGTNFSSVPRVGVRIAINTREGAFVHFQPDYTGSYVIVNKDGYFLNGTYIQAAKAWGCTYLCDHVRLRSVRFSMS